MKLNHCENEVIANNSCYQLADVQLGASPFGSIIASKD